MPSCSPIRSTTPRRLLLRCLPLAGAGLLAACTPSPPAEPESAPPRPALVVPVQMSTAGGLALVGEVRALRRAEPGFAVSGVVSDVLVRQGDRVQAGQVIARLDTAPLLAQRQAAQADEAKALAMREEARRRLARVEAAQAAGATSPGEAGAAQADLAAAESAWRAAKAQAELANWSLERATLRAPIDGTLGLRHLEPGQTAAPGAPAFAIDGGGRELVLLAPASLQVVAGQAVQLQRGAQRLPARVIQASARLEAGGVRRVVVSAPEEAVVGDTWSVQVSHTHRPAVLQVPARAVLRQAAPDTGTVLRLGPDGATVERVTVSLGRLQQDAIEVLSGLAPNDRIVLAGASGIQAGTRVKPVVVTPGAPS